MAVTAVVRPTYSHEQLAAKLSQFIDGRRILVHPIDLIAYGSDASFYWLIPKAVVQAANEQDVARLFQFSHDHALPITFRAAGTSLSGQSISGGLLVEVTRGFRDLQVLENGLTSRVQPGAIGASANRALLPYGAKIGPDPASIATCTLGGILCSPYRRWERPLRRKPRTRISSKFSVSV
jgi:D-lactate dehydrogenase